MTEPALGSRIETVLLRRPLVACAVAGIVAALALPPWHVLPGLLGLAVLVAAIARAPGPGSAFLRGLAFGLPFNLVGLYWVAIAFSAEPEKFGALAVPATVLLALVCGLFQAGYALILNLARIRRPLAVLLGLAALWGVGEWARGAIVGFPWNPLAVVWSISEVSLQLVALTGTAALSVLTAIAAGAVALAFLERRPGLRIAGVAAPLLLGGLAFGYGAWRVSVPLPEPTGLELRLVQANVAQNHKWDPSRLRENFLGHLELSEQDAPVQPRIIIWPESAVPFSLEADEVARTYLARLAAKAGGYVVTGSNHVTRDRQDQLVAHNSVYVIDPEGQISSRYDKVNLVPFGEYLPMRGLLGALGLQAVAARGDFQAGPERTTVELPGIPPFSPLICYEVAFPASATDGQGRARWLLNITNDAWFGNSAGPWQHLALARMRSVEEGLPLVRAANTGISVVTDSYGRILAELGTGERGVIDGRLPAALPERPLGGQLGSLWGWVAIIAIAAGCLFVEYRSRGYTS
ncbi:apolipoprotein N-acyltransferase [Geminicoccus roseus]|uniref:apolipoprotein N-acyltransferase n=1 Tax=Geminicoccus roseus TaxID=404900 RepID=UPI0004093A84|nr:apolipoprotein N-acyltransferase [Geminicoccus roseus]